MDPLLRFCGTLLRGGWAALLPLPERAVFVREHGLDAPRWSAGLGFVQGGMGAFLFIVGGIAFLRGVSGDMSQVLLENWQPGLDSTHVRATGLVGWLAWLVWPGSWPWSYLALVGLARVTAFAVTREAMGEPLLVPILRLVRRVQGDRRVRRREAILGPPRRDRVRRDGDSVIVSSAREKPGWEPGTTVEMEGGYYRVEAVEECRDGAWRCIAYRLVPTAAVSVIRRLVRYAPEGAAGHGSKSRKPPPKRPSRTGRSS